jgi:hypothetical protein
MKFPIILFSAFFVTAPFDVGLAYRKYCAPLAGCKRGPPAGDGGT